MKQPEVWTRIAQGLMASGRHPHFAPEEEVLAVMRELVSTHVARHGNGCRALILGATPELADMALGFGCRVTRVDCNPAMFESAASRQTVAERNAETVLIGDWLDMHQIGDGQVDLVLGDSSLNNVPHHDMQIVLAELARITHPGSMIALRQIVLPDAPVPAYEFAATVAAFRQDEITRKEFHRALRFYSFLAEAYDPAHCMLDAARVFAGICQRHRQGALTDAEFEFLMSRHSEVRHTIYRLGHQRRLLESLGRCEQATPPIEHSARFLFQVFSIHVGKETPRELRERTDGR